MIQELTIEEEPTKVDLQEVFEDKKIVNEKMQKKSKSKLKDRVQIKKSEIEAEKS